MGRSESGDDDGDDSEAWDDEGLMGMKEKEVGVVSDCNTTPSSDWLIPLSHLLIHKEVVGPIEEAPTNSVKVANVALSICRAEVDASTVVTGIGLVEPLLFRLRGVSLPYTPMAPGDALSLLSVPTKVALFRDHAVSLHHVVLVARLAGAKVSMLGRFCRL
jgi:hypothetical protein